MYLLVEHANAWEGRSNSQVGGLGTHADIAGQEIPNAHRRHKGPPAIEQDEQDAPAQGVVGAQVLPVAAVGVLGTVAVVQRAHLGVVLVGDVLVRAFSCGLDTGEGEKGWVS